MALEGAESPSRMDPVTSPLGTQYSYRYVPTGAISLIHSTIRPPAFSDFHLARSGHLSGSYSSTLFFGHEPFEQFKERVQTLCESLRSSREWPNKSLRRKFFASRVSRYLSDSRIFGPIFRHWTPEFQIERLCGGSYNRIVGITLPESRRFPPLTQNSFILRIPRNKDARPDREVALLEHVRQRTNIPVPKVVAKDYCCDNALGLPYVIQQRIPGKDLQMIWDILTHEHRCIVTREIAKTLLKLQSLTSPVPGLIEADGEGSDGCRYATIIPHELKFEQGLVEEQKLDKSCRGRAVRTCDFFVHQMRRWRAVALEKSTGDIYSHRVTLWSPLIHAAKDMDRLGLFKDDVFSLCHLDFEPRNIMAELHQDQSLSITGYLDWDSAVFAPNFVGCAPPRWLWFDGETEYKELDERGADKLPSTRQLREVKQIFEDAVGCDYLHYAYAPQYRLARMLFRFAKDGIWSIEQLDDVRRFLREWAELRSLLEPQLLPGLNGTQRSLG